MGLNEKLNEVYAGLVVKKRFNKIYKRWCKCSYLCALEYLLTHGATDNEEQIVEGVQKVKDILAKNYVRPDEAEIIKSRIKEQGRYKIIDKVSVKLNENKDIYEAEFSNLGIKNIFIDKEHVINYQKLLAGGIGYYDT